MSCKWYLKFCSTLAVSVGRVNINKVVNIDF